MVDVSDRATAREEELREDALQAWRRRRDAARSQLGAQACDQCGTPIPEARRLIVQGVRLCVPCQAAGERLGHVRGVAL
jgi:phage/conjugal plasmid C-4 type zinc finger TraR family protein